MAGTQSEKKKEERKKKKKEYEQKRRDKIRSDPIAYEAAKAKERKRWKKRKDEKKVKEIKDMTPREQRNQRAVWRKEYRTKQENKKRQERALRIATENSPPTSDEESDSTTIRGLDHSTLSSEQGSRSVTSTPSQSTRQREMGQKIMKHNYNLVRRVIEKQHKTIKELQIKINTLKVQNMQNALKSAKRDSRITLTGGKGTCRAIASCALRKTNVRIFLESDENSRIMA